VKSLLDGGHGGKVVFGGSSECDPSQNYVPLTFIREPKKDSSVMTEEIFGPLLPILAVKDVDEAVSFVTSRPKPLALYVFSNSSKTVDKVLAKTTSGGVVVNDAILHNAVSDLPFGGVGPSGMGAYHGRWGFENFSHRKAVFEQPTWVDPHALMYPPYSDRKLAVLEFLFAKMPALPKVGLKDVALWGLAASTAYLGLQVFTVAKGGALSPVLTSAADAIGALIGGGK
jgi:aldehyde dehydrogenase (NAD+)